MTAQVVDGLPLLPEEERRRVLYEWNDTGVEYPSEQCIHELFEEQVKKTPEAAAVVFEDDLLILCGAEPRGRTGWRIICAGWG